MHDALASLLMLFFPCSPFAVFLIRSLFRHLYFLVSFSLALFGLPYCQAWPISDNMFWGDKQAYAAAEGSLGKATVVCAVAFAATRGPDKSQAVDRTAVTASIMLSLEVYTMSHNAGGHRSAAWLNAPSDALCVRRSRRCLWTPWHRALDASL